MERRTALRPVAAADEPFLFRLYASTRADEVAAWGWPRERQEAFLHLQFDAQRRSYDLQFPDAEWRVVAREGAPVGRLVVDRAGPEIRLIDVALLPEHRGQGLGTALVQGLQREGQQARRPVALHVQASNRARGLYERLGFLCRGDPGVYQEMVWMPEAGGAERPALGEGTQAADVREATGPAAAVPSNAHSGFASFHLLVLENLALQDAIRRGAADPGQFVPLIVRLGAERGCPFSADDVLSAMRAERRAWLERWVQ